ncbi:MAG TPA: preprotein translocase subunit YajC [Pseudogracilibacillus sp.]|nr:preprotein translocase subunit YajC [Pseudogracilibacillus sp.]
MQQLAGLLPIILMLVIFYFLLIRPNQKRQKQVREMQAALQKGDKIVTIGGVHGVIDAIDEDVVVIETNSSKLTFDRGAIREVRNDNM